MIQHLLTRQQRHLEYFYKHLDRQAFEHLFEQLTVFAGTLFFSGIGKSGFIAQKIAATMMSTGTRAFFLSPLDALHGDLGMLASQDIVMLLSKSGETRELLELMVALRTRQVTTVAVSSAPQSRLIKESDLFLILPCEEELCPFDLAPTTSAEIQLLFGDVLTIALMQSRSFTLDQYAANHPSGQIGRRATLKVRDLMLDHTRTPFCTPDDRLQDVLLEFTEKQCGCLLVVNAQKQLQGIFTDGDLRRALQIQGELVLQQKLELLMTNRVRSIHADALAWDAICLMEGDRTQPIMVLPVLDREQGKVVGILKMHDLIQAGI